MIPVTYYRMKTKCCHYYAKVVEQYPNVHKVYVGGKKLCVAISVYLDMEEDSHPNIDTLTYDTECNIENNLMQGSGTVHLLKSAMTFVRRMYPQHKTCSFELIDKSHITCSSPNKHTVILPLCYYYIMKYGGTWYEKKLGARKKYDHDGYRKGVRHMMKSLKSVTTQRNEFEPFAAAYGVPKFMWQSMKPVYDTQVSVVEFVKHILGEYDCYVLKDWFKNLCEKYVKVYGDSWIIPYDQQHDVDMEVSVITKPDNIIFGGVHVENGFLGVGGM